MSRPRADKLPERKLWPDEAEFVVLWLDIGFPLREVAHAMGMTVKHARHFLPGRIRKPRARALLERRSAFAQGV